MIANFSHRMERVILDARNSHEKNFAAGWYDTRTSFSCKPKTKITSVACRVLQTDNIIVLAFSKCAGLSAYCVGVCRISSILPNNFFFGAGEFCILKMGISGGFASG